MISWLIDYIMRIECIGPKPFPWFRGWLTIYWELSIFIENNSDKLNTIQTDKQYLHVCIRQTNTLVLASMLSSFAYIKNLTLSLGINPKLYIVLVLHSSPPVIAKRCGLFGFLSLACFLWFPRIGFISGGTLNVMENYLLDLWASHLLGRPLIFWCQTSH